LRVGGEAVHVLDRACGRRFRAFVIRLIFAIRRLHRLGKSFGRAWPEFVDEHLVHAFFKADEYLVQSAVPLEHPSGIHAHKLLPSATRIQAMIPMVQDLLTQLSTSTLLEGGSHLHSVKI